MIVSSVCHRTRGAVLRCRLEYLENGLSKGFVVSGLCKRGLHPFRRSCLVGLLTLGSPRSRIGKAPKIRTGSEEPISRLFEGRPVNAPIAQVEAKDCGRA